MVVTFCGHSKCFISDEEKFKLYNILTNIIKENEKCVFYLGGYGDFDYSCLNLLKQLKKDYSNIETVFVTPYITKGYSKLENANLFYDYTIYPPIENCPLKFAISKRNEWMVDNSNLLICLIDRSYGGAYSTYKYAKRKNIPIINISKSNK